MKNVAGPLLLGVLAFATYAGKSDHATQPASTPGGNSATHSADTDLTPCDPVHGSALQCAVDKFYGQPTDPYSIVHFTPAQANQVRFVIATVPDPVHTDLALLFDRFIEAICSGAQEAGYVFDRAVLPWPLPSGSDKDSKTEDRSKDQVDEKRIKKQREQENSPGLLIFRKPELPRSTQLIVLLVGETPTAGIDKEQFQRALDIIRDPTTSRRSISRNFPTQINIIGPTLSGSFYSLRFLLNQYNGITQDKPFDSHAPHSLFRVWSGVAMSQPAIDLFRSESPDAELLTFKDTDEYEINSFVNYVKTQGYHEDEIALVSEDETTLGILNEPKSNQGIVRIYFPRGISQLRAAYQGDPALSATPSDTDVPHTRLKLDLDSTGSSDDGVSSYGGKQTALSQEAVLMGIITVLRVHPHHFVLLRATDPKDLIFLTRFLRVNFPQDRIVTMTADQLLPRDINDTVFRGVLSLTNYPLLPRQLTEFPHPRPHRVFASTECVGLFNATLALLTDLGVRHTESLPRNIDDITLPTADYAEYTPPVLRENATGHTATKPALWLTVMGDDGYWPLTIVENPSEKSGLRPCPDCELPQQLRLVPSAFNQLVIFGVVAMSLAFIYLSWKGDARKPSTVHQQLAMMTDTTRGTLIGCGSLILVLASVLLGSPLSGENYWAPWVVIGNAASLTISSALNLRARGERRSALVLTISSVAICFPLVWITQPHHSPQESILLYRMAWLQSGVSPTLPMLLICAALLFWVWFMLKVRSLFDLRRPWLPRGISSLPSDDEHNTSHYTEVFSLSRSFLICTALVVCLLALQKFHPLSVDGWNFDLLYLIFFATCVLLIVNSMLSAWQSWKKCRTLLLHLNRTPLRRSFRRIQGFSWKPLWGFAGGDLMGAYKPLSRCLEGFAHLAASVKDDSYKNERDYLRYRGDRVRSDLMQLRNTIGCRTAYRGGQHQRDNDALASHMYALQRNMALMGSLVWLAIVQKTWESDVRLVASGEKSSGSEYGATRPDAASTTQRVEDAEHNAATPENHVVLQAEEFLSLLYINFIHRVLIRVRWLVLAATFLFVLLLFSAKAYPFEPKAAIDGFLILLFIGMAGIVYLIFAEMHRDSILSHLTKKNPGELGSDFWIRLVGFGAVPVFGLVATLVPGLNRLFFQWLKPMIDALHK